MYQASENRLRNVEWQDSTEGTCYSGGRESVCPSGVRIGARVINYKSEVKTSVEMFRRPNTTEEATNGGGFSPISGNEFVVRRSCDRAGIQINRKGSKKSRKDFKDFLEEKKGNLRKELGRKRLWKRKLKVSKKIRRRAPRLPKGLKEANEFP